MNKPFNTFRLNLFTIVLTVILIVFCFISYSLSLQAQKIYENKIQLFLSANKFITASSYLSNEVRAYAATGKEVHYNNFWNEANNLKNRDIALKKMEELGITSYKSDIIKRMSDLSNSLIVLEARAMKDVKNGNLANAIAYVYGDDYNNFVKQINNLKDTVDYHTSIRVDSVAWKNNILQIIICICALLIVIIQILSYLKSKTPILELGSLASIDIFSGLYNKNKYVQSLNQIITDNPDTVGIVCLDINELKQANDKYGYEYGDKLILKVVDIIKSCFLENIFRTGGDEFMVLFVNGERAKFEEKLLNLRNMIKKQSTLSVSIGNTWCLDIHDISKQIAHANELMHVDKQNYYINYKSKLKSYKETVASELQEAIKKNQFTVLLQPKVRLVDKKIVGAEALVRKKDEKGEFISPDKFISIYEVDGIVSLLDFHVLETVCKMLKKWQDEGHPLIHISVNFSRISILEHNVAKKMYAICQKYNIDTKLITIELTEHINNILLENLKETLDEVKSFGFQISLDDFGREYANLSILSKIAFNEIKLDKSLIEDIATNPATSIATRCIVEICNAYSPTKMVVKGIETSGQISKLNELNGVLPIVQGYYFSKPLQVDEFLEYQISREALNKKQENNEKDIIND